MRGFGLDVKLQPIATVDYNYFIIIQIETSLLCRPQGIESHLPTSATKPPEL